MPQINRARQHGARSEIKGVTGMPVIDIHEHLSSKPINMGDALKDGIPTPADLVEIMDRGGIDQMVVLPLTSPETFPIIHSVEEVFEAISRYPHRFIPFCNTDPRLSRNDPDYDFMPVLNYYKSLGAKGIGEVTCNLFWDDPRVQNLLGACEKAGLPLIFHQTVREFKTYGLIDPKPGLHGLERSLVKFPALKFFGHSPGFWNEVAPVADSERVGYPQGKVMPGGRVLELLRRYPNLYGDLSAGSGYGAVSRDPDWGYAFIEEFQDRLLMGLDICHPVMAAKRLELLTFLRAAVASGKISRGAFDKVMGGNAVRILGL